MKLPQSVKTMFAGLIVVTLAVCSSNQHDDSEVSIKSIVDTSEFSEPDSGIDFVGSSVASRSGISLQDNPNSDPGEDRKLAPDFTLSDMSGKPHRISSYDGKVVLLDFWATTCGPCKVEIPHLEAIYKKYRDQGFVSLGIALDKRSNLERYLSKTPIVYTILVDEKDISASLYGVTGIPRTILIDKKGRIAFDHTGYRSGMEVDIEKEVATLLEE